MSILAVRSLSLAYGEKVLYENIELDLFRGEHLGLVGPNGAGKSTFLQTIIGQNFPDDGKVEWHPKTKVGYLDQHAVVDKNLTIQKYLETAFAHLFVACERLEKNLVLLETAYNEKILKKVLNDQEFLLENNFASVQARIGKIATGLGLTALGMDKKLNNLSGGQRAKVILAKLLLDEPNLLLLDEPTNFLDKEHVDWLSLFLKNYAHAFILISHDTHFLDRVTTHTAHLEKGKLQKYRGNYSAFTKQKEMAAQLAGKLYQKQCKFIEKTQDYIARNSARSSTAKQAQSRVKMLERLEKVDPPSKAIKPQFLFRTASTTTGEALRVNDLQVGYENPLLPPLNLNVMSGEKIVITGFNGIGKSTLLKTLVGVLPALGGKFDFVYGTQVNYLEQDLNWPEPTINALEVVSEHFPHLEQGAIRSMLARYGVKAQLVRQPLCSLSGGEQTKVKIALLALQPSNFIILDEPTNHLDPLSKDALRDAICKFAGTVILVSHEQTFYREFVDRIFDLTSSV